MVLDDEEDPDDRSERLDGVRLPQGIEGWYIAACRVIGVPLWRRARRCRSRSWASRHEVRFSVSPDLTVSWRMEQIVVKGDIDLCQ